MPKLQITYMVMIVAVVCGSCGESNDLIPDGDYFLGAQLNSFGGIKLRFKVTLTADGSLEQGGVLKTLELRSLSEEGDSLVESDVLAALDAVEVNAGGSFIADFGDLILAAESNPAGLDIPMSLSLAGTIAKDHTFCGEATGFVPVLNADLSGTTFKAVPFIDYDAQSFEVSCQAGNVEYQHISQCPVIQVGNNTMISAERSRTFDLYVPDALTDADSFTDAGSFSDVGDLPIVFLFHGTTSDPERITSITGFPDMVDGQSFILVVPLSARDDEGEAINAVDWHFTIENFDVDNIDLVFFDDMLTCIGEQYPVDDQRVYVAGMSGGGLMSTFLAANRSDMIAAAGLGSGGYMFDWPENNHKVPVIMAWGGEADSVFSLDFNALALDLIHDLETHHHTLISCNHGLGHQWPADYTPAVWDFLMRFTLDNAANPFADPLPAVYPDYCQLHQN